MTSTSLKNSLQRVALAVGLALCALPSASAAVIVTGSYDPIYGSPFTGTDGSGMYWRGSSTFVFEDSCSLQSDFTLTTVNQPDCRMTVRDSAIELFDGDPLGGGSRFATINFGSATANIAKAIFVGGNLTGVYSDYFNPWKTATIDPLKTALFGVDGYTFTLAFNEEGATLFHAATTKTERHDQHIGWGEFWEGNGYGHLAKACKPGTIDKDYCGYSNNVAKVTFGSLLYVPEPGSVPLLFAGLMAISLAARQRRRD